MWEGRKVHNFCSELSIMLTFASQYYFHSYLRRMQNIKITYRKLGSIDLTKVVGAMVYIQPNVGLQYALSITIFRISFPYPEEAH